MPKQRRKTLYNYFLNGNLPNEKNFEDLIDSNVNIVDDGIDKTAQDGLILSRVAPSDRLMSLYKQIQNQDNAPDWVVNIPSDGESNGLNLGEPQSSSQDVDSRLFLQSGGGVGIGTKNPRFGLQVEGYVSSQGRVGAITGEVPADRKWHPVLTGLDGANGYEIVARTGVLKSGLHCLVHAIALSTFGRSRSKIKRVRAFYTWWKPCNIKMRWKGTTHDYRLEIKCTRNLGDDVTVRYYITKLWQDAMMSGGIFDDAMGGSNGAQASGTAAAGGSADSSGAASGQQAKQTTAAEAEGEASKTMTDAIEVVETTLASTTKTSPRPTKKKSAVEMARARSAAAKAAARRAGRGGTQRK